MHICAEDALLKPCRPHSAQIYSMAYIIYACVEASMTCESQANALPVSSPVCVCVVLLCCCSQWPTCKALEDTVARQSTGQFT